MLKTRLALLFFIFLFLFFSVPARASENYSYTYLTDDVYVQNQSWVDTNFNSATYNYALVLSGNPSPTARIYMRWNTYPLISNATVIDSAYIYLYFYAGIRTTDYFLIYNTSQNWTENNMTWNNQTPAYTLQSNESIAMLDYAKYYKFNVTNALQKAISSNQNLSIMIRFNNESQSSADYRTFVSAESTDSHKPILEISSHVSNCNIDCGDCGCKINSSECYTPSIIGSYCDVEDGQPNTIKTVFNTSCTGTTYYACPNGTVCSQVSPIFNFSNFENAIGTAPEESDWCHGCFFFNLLTGWPAHWVNIRTNCPSKPECNCYGIFCSNFIYNATNNTLPETNIIEEWTAGCFNPTTGLYSNIINSTAQNTTLEDLVLSNCPNCTLTNNTPLTKCQTNTSTTCYDSACNVVQCSIIAPTTCVDNIGGQSALAIGGLMGITDCGLSKNIVSLLASIMIGFAVLYYTKDSNQSGMAFIVGTLAPLTMFSLVSWFPAWLIVILIVISAYAIAKSLGIGGGG